MFFAKSAIVVFAMLTFVCIFDASCGMPSIGHYDKRFDSMSGIDYINICLNNCGQCKEMYGDFFLGQICAESCLKMKGKAIPDCVNMDSIRPFLNTIV